VGDRIIRDEESAAAERARLVSIIRHFLY